ncbi:hypothetical protein IG631_22882 [Alternaria alternata]|nr:hypothetical protein IG631_22882 [Alternaria alternata]
MNEPVSLTFSLKYLTNFCKASGLSDSVKLCLSSEVPLLVEYALQDQSYLRFYLAPKAVPRGVPRPRHKRKVTAPPTLHVIPRGISDKEDQHSKSTTYPACTFVPAFHLLYLLFSLSGVNMASDTLIPDTRVLAIASHVRLTGGRCVL